MQIWTPRWTTEAPDAHPSTTSFFGGVPRGLPAERWPVCKECNQVMTPLLQLAAGPWVPRIPHGHLLLVFKCERDGICSFWDSDSGANACLLVAVTDLDEHLASLPAGVIGGETSLLPQIWVDLWTPADDGLTPEQAEAVDDPVRFWDLPDEIQMPRGYESEWLTKSGGAPYWTGNGPDTDLPLPRQLLFQIDNWIIVSGSHESVVEHLEASGSSAHVGENGAVSAANFMSDGIAYLFDVTPDAPQPTLRLTIKR